MISMRRRRKHIFWEYNCDGIFKKERYGHFGKRYWNKWEKRELLKDQFKQIHEHFSSIRIAVR